MYPNFYAYPALFYYDDDGISIEFPDLPGCLSCAEDTEEAKKEKLLTQKSA
jgi:predicted RNase H-like HicB family nuclease